MTASASMSHLGLNSGFIIIHLFIIQLSIYIFVYLLVYLFIDLLVYLFIY